MNKTPTNTAALNSLKSQGWKIYVEHYRRPYDDMFSQKLVKDKDYRNSLNGASNPSWFWNDEIDHFGGATVLKLIRGEEEIAVRADCYIGDRFTRRLGVAACLKKLESLYGIK